MTVPGTPLAPQAPQAPRKRVFMLGATGTIGAATVRALAQRGHDVVCFVRPRDAAACDAIAEQLFPATVRFGRVADPASLRADGLRDEAFDAVVSCMASRTGTPRDAWAVDHDAHITTLEVAKERGISHMVLLSAICVQRPLLAFQRAKLAFESTLASSGLTYSIARPTAFFKSLSGQIARVQSGRPFLVFGDGRLTACKPISDRDLATFLANTLDDTQLHNQVLPIGGPGEAITPLDQAHMLFDLLGQPAKIRRVPTGLLRTIALGLGVCGRLVPSLADKAELAKIGHYYATQSMLALDPQTGEYNAAATPSFGSDTLVEHYRAVLAGETVVKRGDHAVF